MSGRRKAGIGFVVVFILLAGLVALLDGREAWHVVRHADWGVLPAAFACTALSYFFLSAGYSSINRLFGIRLGQRDLLEIGFVSSALNNLVSVGGLAGYSLRLFLMRRRGFATGDIMGASLVHSYFNHVVMVGLLPVGLFYILVHHPLGRTQTGWIALATVAAVALVAATTRVLLHQPSRRRLARWLRSLAGLVLRRDVGPTLDRLDMTLEGGVASMHAHPAVLRLPLLFVLLDWIASVATLGFCFDALGDPIHLGVLVTGFAIGVSAGFLSMLPGGMGAQEGSMTGIYVLLGVDLEHAALAALLFRLVYYLVPFACSVLLYIRMLRQPTLQADSGRDTAEEHP
jgi:uncharacterized protein (TIRG00374 family)